MTTNYRGYTITVERVPDYGDLRDSGWMYRAGCKEFNLSEYGDTSQEAIDLCKSEIDEELE